MPAAMTSTATAIRSRTRLYAAADASLGAATAVTDPFGSMRRLWRDSPVPAAGSCSGGVGHLGHRRVVHLGDVFPIDQMIDKGLEIVRPPVAIVDVVGVFP